jgi:prepilin-type N-terminal cleavage/methylation domain-containing protein
MESRIGAQDGFTLIELLMVILIVGILGMVGIATLFSTRATGNDGAAKQLMHTAQVTAVTYGVTNGYATMTPAALAGIEKTINTTANGKAVLVNAAPTATGYFLTVVSSSADTFNLTNTAGVVTRTCIVAPGNGNTATNTGGGCRNGVW